MAPTDHPAFADHAIDGNVRRHRAVAQLLDEGGHVVSLVRSERDMLFDGAGEEAWARKIGADAWFEFKGADEHEIQEQSLMLPNSRVSGGLLLAVARGPSPCCAACAAPRRPCGAARRPGEPSSRRIVGDDLARCSPAAPAAQQILLSTPGRRQRRVPPRLVLERGLGAGAEITAYQCPRISTAATPASG